MINRQESIRLARVYSQENKHDILLCSGPMDEHLDERIHECLAKRKHPNLLLVLATSGGDLHVAYRVARHLQRSYEQIRVYVAGWCKSAGTLLAVCGNELIIGDRGELGPVDVQIGRTDDLWESTSGLTESTALSTLEEISWSLFRRWVIETKRLSGGNITFKTAAEAAAPLVSEMLKPIFGQIDPLKLGENTRLLNIAQEYLARIAIHSENLATGYDVLVSGYPDHGFVIDREEAKKLFKHVEKPNLELRELTNALGEIVLRPRADRLVLALVDQLPLNNEGASDDEHEGDENRTEIDPKTDGSVSANSSTNGGGISSDSKGRTSPAEDEAS